MCVTEQWNSCRPRPNDTSAKRSRGGRQRRGADLDRDGDRGLGFFGSSVESGGSRIDSQRVTPRSPKKKADQILD